MLEISMVMCPSKPYLNFDPILRIGSAVVEPENFDGRKHQVTDKVVVAIDGAIKEPLPRGFGKVIQALATSGLGDEGHDG